DAAQAIGARRSIDGEWRVAGELGWVTGYSFFPSKNLGAWGDGGMMVTSDDQVAERLRRLRLHGGAKQYHHDEVGTNSRLDTVQGSERCDYVVDAIGGFYRWAAGGSGWSGPERGGRTTSAPPRRSPTRSSRRCATPTPRSASA